MLRIDDFALRKGNVYAAVMIDATTGRRVDVIEGRGAEVVKTWLDEHPGVKIVCRYGATSYAQAVRDSLPETVQVVDRWHPWCELGDAVLREAQAHSACWVGATGVRTGKLAETTMERWRQVHELPDASVGLLASGPRHSRRVGLWPVSLLVGRMGAGVSGPAWMEVLQATIQSRNTPAYAIFPSRRARRRARLASHPPARSPVHDHRPA